MNRNSIGLVCLACVVVLTACAPRPELPSKSAATPAGVDLSGSWRIRAAAAGPRAREGEQPQTIQVPPSSSSRRPQEKGRRPRSGAADGGADVWIFLEIGKVLGVTQTRDGLFISFDRSVVEAYTFGENRTVSVGPIEAQRVSGWVGHKLVLETMDKQGTVLTETWALDEGGAVLVRDIVVTQDERQLFSARQVFDQA